MSDASLNSLTSQALTSLAAHAHEEYPLECCGFVFADGTVHARRTSRANWRTSSRVNTVEPPRMGTRCPLPTR